MIPAVGELQHRWLARAAVLILVVLLLLPTTVAAITYEPSSLQRGTITKPANGTTVISVQGFKVAGQQSEKKPARLIGVGPRGDVNWVYNGSKFGIVWFYDVDPVKNGSLLITGTRPGKTVVTVWNPQTGETAWTRTFGWEDTHDIDLINDDQLLVGNMRNYNETTELNDDRILIYNLSQDEVVWEWKFRNNGYNRSGGGQYSDDWTHVNDVDKLDDGRYLASPRNFDQVIVVNRTTGDVAQQLGEDESHSTLYEQHNPQYLRGTDGTPTMLISDSENDRVVEYTKQAGQWRRTWTLKGDFQWPRDADRLPSGNTLVTDTLNHRVMEVTPSGDVVWEFYAPWGPYDAERIQFGDEPSGPTIREQNKTGTVTLNGSASLSPGTGDRLSFSQWMRNAFAGTPVDGEVEWLAERWAHITPWIRPVWMGPWDFVRTVFAGLLVLGWISVEGLYHRRRVRKYLSSIRNRLS